MKYAIVCNGKVIDVVIVDKTPYFPKTNDGFDLIPIELGEYENVEKGAIYEDGVFLYSPDTKIIEQELSWQELDDIVKSEILLSQQEILIKLNNQEVLIEQLLNKGGN